MAEPIRIESPTPETLRALAELRPDASRRARPCGCDGENQCPQHAQVRKIAHLRWAKRG